MKKSFLIAVVVLTTILATKANNVVTYYNDSSQTQHANLLTLHP